LATKVYLRKLRFYNGLSSDTKPHFHTKNGRTKFQKVFGIFSSEKTEEQLQLVKKYRGKIKNKNNIV
jgi:hypothetical protein